LKNLLNFACQKGKIKNSEIQKFLRVFNATAPDTPKNFSTATS